MPPYEERMDVGVGVEVENLESYYGGGVPSSIDPKTESSAFVPILEFLPIPAMIFSCKIFLKFCYPCDVMLNGI